MNQIPVPNEHGFSEPAAGLLQRELPVAPASVTAARISGLISVTILGMATLVIMLVTLLLAPLSATAKFLLLAAWLAGVLLLLLLSIYYPGLSYRYLRWRLDDQGLWIKRGVVWRREISVPRSRVQHTDVSQGPLQRKFDIASLIVHTAGTVNASVSLDGLAHSTAIQIRNFLIEGGDDVSV